MPSTVPTTSFVSLDGRPKPFAAALAAPGRKVSMTVEAVEPLRAWRRVGRNALAWLQMSMSAAMRRSMAQSRGCAVQ